MCIKAKTQICLDSISVVCEEKNSDLRERTVLFDYSASVDNFLIP